MTGTRVMAGTRVVVVGDESKLGKTEQVGQDESKLGKTRARRVGQDERKLGKTRQSATHQPHRPAICHCHPALSIWSRMVSPNGQPDDGISKWTIWRYHRLSMEIPSTTRLFQLVNPSFEQGNLSTEMTHQVARKLRRSSCSRILSCPILSYPLLS